MTTYQFSDAMNKWQIICPIAFLFVVGVWGIHKHFQTDDRVMRNAIERHLRLVLAELEKHQTGGRFPTVEVARTVLSDKEVEKRVQATSLFTVRDLLYNSSQPAVGGSTFVLCARIGESLFGIRANRDVTETAMNELQKAEFLPLGDAAGAAR